MTSYRWTLHRLVDAHGNNWEGHAAISMWWIAHAAVEETLQGSPMVSAWLKLFQTHLSDEERCWLQWRGDLAESAELRRAYSGLYGRFIARALLTHHLGFSRFLPLKRNGLLNHAFVKVERVKRGDMPDWLGWDDRNLCYVLCEAKGRLTGDNFFSLQIPRCIKTGKDQFGRVKTSINGKVIHPACWVAATRWATDARNGRPATILWDPPIEGTSFGEEEAAMHRKLITRAWLGSIALGLGCTDAYDLLSQESTGKGLVISASPGQTLGIKDWSPYEDEFEEGILKSTMAVDNYASEAYPESYGNLLESEYYAETPVLEPPKAEFSAHEQSYSAAALITRFGIRPLKTNIDFEAMRLAQDSARERKEPAMVVGVPHGIDDFVAGANKELWLDRAGIAHPDGLAVFDLGLVEVGLF